MSEREQKYAEAIAGGAERAAILVAHNPGELANAYRDARAVMAVADAEQAELRAENERLKHVLAMTKYREEQWEERFPCDGGCTPQYGPEETCSRDGRKPDDLWRIISEEVARAEAAEAERDALRAQVEAVRALADECENQSFDTSLRLVAGEIRAALSSSEPVTAGGD